MLLGCALQLAVACAAAQLPAEVSVQLHGETVHYALRKFVPDAHLVDPSVRLEPASALNTAILLNRHLSAGRIEDAALLSNAPRRRSKVFEDYRAAVGMDAFRQVFAEYLLPENRVVAELAIGRHRLLVWHLTRADRLVGQYYVDVEGRYLIDDVPSMTRTQLRRLLDAYRAGTIAN